MSTNKLKQPWKSPKLSLLLFIRLSGTIDHSYVISSCNQMLGSKSHFRLSSNYLKVVFSLWDGHYRSEPISKQSGQLWTFGIKQSPSDTHCLFNCGFKPRCLRHLPIKTFWAPWRSHRHFPEISVHDTHVGLAPVWAYCPLGKLYVSRQETRLAVQTHRYVPHHLRWMVTLGILQPIDGQIQCINLTWQCDNSLHEK